MNKHQLYDPEDLESLLEHKNFNELYPEERQFVLRHIDSESEYESLRQTLLSLRGLVKNDVDLTPNQSIRRNVMDVFEASHKRPGFSLNAWFMLFSERFNGYKPVLAFGVVLGIIGVSLYSYFASSSDAEMLVDNSRSSRVERSINADGGEALEFDERIEPATSQESTIPAVADDAVEVVSSSDMDADFDNESVANFDVAEEILVPSKKAEAKMNEMVADVHVPGNEETTKITKDLAEAEESIMLNDKTTDLSFSPTLSNVPTSADTYTLESVEIASTRGVRQNAFVAPVVEKVYFNWVKTAY